MLLGKSVRLERIFNRNTGRTIIVPMDHGVTVGPIYGLLDLPGTVNKVAEGGANAVLMHKGLPRCTHRGYGKDVGLIVHLSASTSIATLPNAKSLVGTVEDALRLGADAVSVHVNLGDETERYMLEDLGKVTSRAVEWGMPVLAMMYARGPKVQNEFDPAIIAHCARVGMELGADVVKVNYTGDMDSFAYVCEACCVPLVIAGGPKMDSDRALVEMVHDSVKAGGAGLSMGRNVFQHARPDLLVAALHGVVHSEWTVDKAMAVLEAN
ncbi:2-amino-3,7-dideoxy-D-threo-hept-6-ulosonate synthase [Desulfovibrio psychrotolerans]|uniref:2-amino-3,7-dideoxy-D-threo-hept-6-ulosonate synthase n=1 Tax=Desulfovibrio psychrotolerans TaxID=415242 RepID=A0A7J0BVK5_9BACT|nr:2-amino-3,7-dideoxy-D-threo-hept-6-ulosonate synthase [Desulfovibrio psychrotolerans]GFM37756.1 2-amino-3,7-dideoxy-D-threo-hept-6-ulosonate synthase [Desulfovibrio psychrotolerans]